MNRNRRIKAARQPLKGEPSSIGLGGFNFSKRIIKKYSFSKRADRLPALVFLRLFGLRDIDRKNPIEKNTSVEWRFNNYFEFHFYTGVIRKSIKAPVDLPQKQCNIASYHRNLLQAGLIGNMVGQQSSVPQKFLRVSGDSAHSYPALERKGLLPVFYTITGSDKLTVKSIVKPAIKSTVKSTVKLTVLPTRHITGSYLQKIFNMVNTVAGSPTTATKELLINKSKNPEEADISSLLQSVRDHNGNIPEKYEKDGKNFLFPVLVPVTSPAKTALDSMNLAGIGHLQKISAKYEGLKYKTTPPSGIQSSNKESRSSDLIPTRMKIPTYKHVFSERADTELKLITRQERFVKTVLNRNILTGLILNVQKMNERLSGRKLGTFPDNFIPAKSGLYFAGNPGNNEKTVQIEDTIDTIVRKHTDLVLRKTSGDNITNDIKKQDAMKTTNGEVRERIINKNISHERKPDDVNTIADTVYKLIERRLLIEKEKRGLV